MNSLEGQIIGVSVDDTECHKKWIEELGVKYMLASDVEGNLSRDMGVLDERDNRSHRATFIISPSLNIEFAMVTCRNIGRSVQETIRVFEALQTGQKCPVDYKPIIK